MKTAITWISDWRHALTALGFAALAVVAAIFVPLSRWEKLGALIERIVEDPAGALAFVALVGGAITTLRGAWMRQPPPPPTALLLVALLLPALTGCGGGALRTHQTIATIARVSVVAAHPAIVSTCETLTSRCTDVACVERVTADCDAAGTARDVAHAAVRAYVDTIEIAARADEGQVAAALDLALQTVADAYDAARTTIARLTGYQLPELPPIAVTILRALAAQVVPGGAS